MKLGLVLKLLLGTGVMGLITFNISGAGLVFWFSLLVFVVLLVVTVLFLFFNLSEYFTSE